MVFNKYHTRNSKEKKYDEWDGQLVLANARARRII